MYRETSTSEHELCRDDKENQSSITMPARFTDSAVEVPLDSKFLGATHEKVFHPQFLSLNEDDDKDHIIVAFPIVDTTLPPLVRIHSECLTGDLFGSLRCDCGPQLRFSVEQIERSGGYLIYLRQEGRGIGLRNKLKAYRLQDEGFDTFAANEKLGFKKDGRDFEMAAKALKKLGVHKIRLITNNPEKIKQLVDAGVAVESVVATPFFNNRFNQKYLDSKKNKAGHFLVVREELQ